jgi:stearoyl-CoA desaturase (delta-9 desaturase)
MFSTYKMNFPADFEYVKDLLKDSIHSWFFKYYWFINFGLWLSLAIIDIDYLILWLGIIGFHGFKNKAMNVIGHNNPSTQESCNSIIHGWIYLHGEPWHRNHHDDPTDWRLGHRWYEVDLGARLIQLCVFLGWGKLRASSKESSDK